MSIPENPSFGPKGIETAIEAIARSQQISIAEAEKQLNSIRTSLKIEETRLGKIYDFAFGLLCMRFSVRTVSPDEFIESCRLLAVTESMPELPNRKKLVSVLEIAMGTEGRT